MTDSDTAILLVCDHIQRHSRWIMINFMRLFTINQKNLFFSILLITAIIGPIGAAKASLKSWYGISYPHWAEPEPTNGIINIPSDLRQKQKYSVNRYIKLENSVDGLEKNFNTNTPIFLSISRNQYTRIELIAFSKYEKFAYSQGAPISIGAFSHFDYQFRSKVPEYLIILANLPPKDRNKYLDNASKVQKMNFRAAAKFLREINDVPFGINFDFLK